MILAGMFIAWAVGIATGWAVKGLIEERSQDGDTT